MLGNEMKLKTKFFALVGVVLSTWSLGTLAQTEMSAKLDNALQGQQRSAINIARDVFRHPQETLIFFGLQPNMQVLEILPGRGWYTEILAPLLSDEGQLTAASYNDKHPHKYLRSLHIDFMKKMNADAGTYGKVKVVDFGEDNYLSDIADNSMDMVLTFRSTHNWIRFGGIEDVYANLYRVLKPGGILGVVQHRANADADHKVSAKQGYVPEKYLINLIEKMGLELVQKSNINANSLDSKDYPDGVWSLPPTFRSDDKEKYSAIGESDRMTLKFVKIQ